MAAALKNTTGIGMTSQRTRARMVERLREQKCQRSHGEAHAR